MSSRAAWRASSCTSDRCTTTTSWTRPRPGAASTPSTPGGATCRRSWPATSSCRGRPRSPPRSAPRSPGCWPARSAGCARDRSRSSATPTTCRGPNRATSPRSTARRRRCSARRRASGRSWPGSTETRSMSSPTTATPTGWCSRSSTTCSTSPPPPSSWASPPATTSKKACTRCRWCARCRTGAAAATSCETSSVGRSNRSSATRRWRSCGPTTGSPVRSSRRRATWRWPNRRATGSGPGTRARRRRGPASCPHSAAAIGAGGVVADSRP